MRAPSHRSVLRSSSLPVLAFLAAAAAWGCGDSAPAPKDGGAGGNRADGGGAGSGGSTSTGTGGQGGLGSGTDGGADTATGAGGATAGNGGAGGGAGVGGGGGAGACTPAQGCALSGTVNGVCGAAGCEACTTDSACSTAYGAGHLCVAGSCVTGDCHGGADCNGKICDAATNNCTACTDDTSCVTAFGANQLCQTGVCVAGNCRTHADCTGGQLCDAGSQTCVACSADMSCVNALGAGHLCVSGGCVTGNCRAGTDCTAGQICAVATHTCSSCADDNGCQTSYGAGHLCENGVCVPGNCRALADCSNGQLCTGNACTACSSDGQCGSGQLCLSGGCTAGDCRAATDCSGGKVCTGNSCSGCASDLACVSGYGANHLCESGACVTGNCRGTADCAAGGLLCGAATRSCGACTSDAQCADPAGYGAGHICVGGVCTPGDCHTSSDCAAGALCNLASHSCSACTDDQSCVAGYGAQHLCVSGACVSGQCRVSPDCSGGQLCNAATFTCGACSTDAQCVTGYGANHLCVSGACVSGQCHATSDCGGGQICNTGSLACVACATDTQCVTDYGPVHLCLSGQCAAGECRTSSDCTGGKVCDTSTHLCAACGADTTCKSDSAYGSTTICLSGACTAGDCHDTSADCTAGQLCGASLAHTCGTCGSDGQCTGDGRYGTGNICFQGSCQPGNCHAASADCTASNAGLLCGATTPNTCGPCTSDGQCKADPYYGNSTICTTANLPTKGTCVTVGCMTNGVACTANAADFCCNKLCVPGNCCSDTDCVNNSSFGVGYACVGNSCTQCAPASGNKYYVDPVNGNDQTATGSGLSGGNTTPSCRFKTVTRAIAVIGSFAPANTKVIIVGTGASTGLSTGDALPITLPPNVILSTQGGPITITLPAAASQGNPNSTSGFVLSSNGSGIAGDPQAPLTLDGNGHTSGIAVAVSGAANTVSLSNLTIQNTRGHGISVTSGTLNIGAGVVVKSAGTTTVSRNGLNVAGTITGGAVSAAGVANISVPSGGSQTLFSGNSAHGIEVTTGGSVNITGVPGTPLPSNNGTVVVSLNTTTGLRIAQTAGTTGLATSTIDGVVAWGNGNYGARIYGGSKVKIRNSVFGANGTDGILLSNQNNGATGTDLSAINLGTAADFGHNWLQVPLGSTGTNATAGLCVNLGNNNGGTLQAAGNHMVTGTGSGTPVDCSTTTTAAVTRGTCSNRNSLGVANNTTVTVVLNNCLVARGQGYSSSMGRIQVHFRNKLFAGALAAIPVVVTIFILWWIDSKARAILEVETPFVGILVTVVALYLMGLFVTSLLGQFLLGITDSVIRRVPGLRDLYRSWKQVALTTDRQEGVFARVVLIPDETGWMRVLGFSSGRPIDGDPGMWCVFVPASPNPTSGRLFFVPVESCVLVDMQPQEALKVIISGGNYVPSAIGAASAGRGPISRPLPTT